jgi:hypothetical protein
MTPAVRELRFDAEREAEFRIPSERPLALTSNFAGDAQKIIQWAAFVRRTRRPDLHDLPAIVAALDRFLWPAPSCGSTGAVVAHMVGWRPVERALA